MVGGGRRTLGSVALQPTPQALFQLISWNISGGAASQRKPPELKALAGTDRADREASNVSSFSPKLEIVPSPPYWLADTAAVREWAHLGLLASFDLGRLAKRGSPNQAKIAIRLRALTWVLA